MKLTSCDVAHAGVSVRTARSTRTGGARSLSWEFTAGCSMPRSYAHAMVWLMLNLVAHAAGASTLSVINEVRAGHCLHAPAEPLHETAPLDAAAARLARGYSLHEVLQTLPERALAAAAVRLPDRPDPAALTRAMAERFCAELSSTGLSQVGIAHAGANLWVIVAQPAPADSPGERAAAEQAVLRAVNRARGQGRYCGARYFGPAPGVAYSSALAEVARDHSREMAAADELEHAGRHGETAADRVRRAALPALHVGENIASGPARGEEAAAGWLASPDHCSVIMDPRYTQMGVAYTSLAGRSGVPYWTQLFTERR